MSDTIERRQYVGHEHHHQQDQEQDSEEAQIVRFCVGSDAAMWETALGAHFPKFVLHCRATVHELRKVMGTRKSMILVPLSI
jgi:hypothetical protein